MTIPQCRFCRQPLTTSLIDLGMAPFSNSYLTKEALDQPEKFYPLHARICSACFLVQLEAFEPPETIFSDYAYFSSFSDSWLSSMERYAHAMIDRCALDAASSVIEIASNDGYLLQFFAKKNIPVLGIEPAGNVAQFAREKGIPTQVKFFGVKTARELVSEGKQADLLIGNNVLAHVPDINDFVQGMKIILKADGVITMEFPHFLQLFNNTLFDTIYHEHFSYLSLITVERIFSAFGLTIFDVDEIETHGGSLRIFARHAENSSLEISGDVQRVKQAEIDAGFDRIESYASFKPGVEKIKRDLLSFLIDVKDAGKTIAGYGAPAKGNTLLNYCGIRSDFLEYTVDRSPHKQGKYLPCSHIPIHAPDRIIATKPDFVLILPWNIKSEVMTQMASIKDWGGKFVVALPKLEILG